MTPVKHSQISFLMFGGHCRLGEYPVNLGSKRSKGQGIWLEVAVRVLHHAAPRERMNKCLAFWNSGTLFPAPSG